MKKYDSYKDSGIEWIGEIPEHWEECRLGVIGGFTSSGIDKKIVEDELTVKIINYTDVYGNKEKILNTEKDYMEVTSPQSKINQHSVKKGDLIFTLSSETKEDIGLSAVVVDDLVNTAFSYHVLRFQFNKEVNLLFKKYLCNNYPVLNYFSKNSKGTTRQILGREDFKNAKVVIPPISEQTSIASFLDRKTSEIDEIIADKKRLLELYEEEKTAIINQAVTKGLDPNAPMKDSGIEWIGEIPEHWEVSRIKYYLDYQKGKNPKEINFDKGSTSEIYLAMDFLRGEPRQILYVDDTDGYVKVDENEILLLWDGSNAGEFILSKRGILSSTMAVIYLNNIKKRYSWYYLKNFEPRLKENTIGMGIPHVNGEELKNGYITIPPISEQTSIANFLDLKTSEIDEIIADKKRLLELYEEEKTAIINQAVTKGLDPNAPMKDSGIEWLGEIPEHWEVKKLNWSFEDIGSGTTPKADNQLYYYNGNINWLLTGDLNDGEIYDTSKKITQKAIDDYGTLRVYPAEIGRASCRERV